MEYELLSNGKVQIGGKAPDFTSNSTQGEISISNNNMWTVIFSYKEDFYPISTSEIVEFEKNRYLFNEMNTKIIGMSMGTLLSHYAWINDIYNTYGIVINIPLLDDPIGEVCRKYGTISKEINNCVTNNVIIIDDKGIVRSILEYSPEIERNIYEIIRILKILKEYAFGYNK